MLVRPRPACIAEVWGDIAGKKEGQARRFARNPLGGVFPMAADIEQLDRKLEEKGGHERHMTEH